MGKIPPYPPVGDGAWEDYMLKIDCPEENLQLLCKPCHSVKTSEEKAAKVY